MTRTKAKIPTTAESVLRDVKWALRELTLPSRLRLTAEQAQQITAWANDYGDALNQMTAVKPGKTQWAMIENLVFNSFPAKLCACIRALAWRTHDLDYQKIVAMAEGLDVYKPLKEAVTAWWRPKDKGFRLICKDGPLRTAQRLLLRDALLLMGVESEFDVTRRGGGGERELVKFVVEAMDDHPWWVTSDVKNCFPSLRPGHFRWLGIDRRLLLNVVFLPKCAKVNVLPPEDPAAVALAIWGEALSPSVIIDLTSEMVRQGLPQGSVLSPLLARGFLGRELRALLGAHNVVAKSYCDDVLIGARARMAAQAALDALTARLKSHTAGPIYLHDSKPIHKDTMRTTVLGYILEPGKGHGDNPVHVKPGPKRIRRHKKKLEQRLQGAPLDDLHRIGSTYWARWFHSQLAWTKVPGYTRELSRNITASYVDDFKLGIPMGKNWRPKS